MSNRTPPKEQKKHWQAYLDSGLSQTEYARQNGISRSALSNWGMKYSSEIGKRDLMKYSWDEIDNMLDEYIESRSLRSGWFTKKYGITEAQFGDWFKKRRGGLTNHYNRLHKEYVNEFKNSNLTQKEFAQKYDLDVTSLQRWIYKYYPEGLGKRYTARANKEGNNFIVYGLYKWNLVINSLDDGLFYIGITNDIDTRIRQHMSKRCNNQLKNEYIEEYGFKLIPLWTNLSLQEAEHRELFLIYWFGQIIDETGILTNKCNRIRGWNNPNKGIKLPQKWKDNIGKASKERWKNPEFQKRQRDAQLSHSYEDIMKWLDEYDNSLELDATKWQKEHNIRKNAWSTWIDRYRPDLRNHKKKVWKYWTDKWEKSGLTKEKFAIQNKISSSSLSYWIQKRKAGEI